MLVPLPLSLLPERFNAPRNHAAGRFCSFGGSQLQSLQGCSLQIRLDVIQYMGLSDHGRLRLRRLAFWGPTLSWVSCIFCHCRAWAATKRNPRAAIRAGLGGGAANPVARRALRAQAGLHERLAFVTLQGFGFGIGITAGHLALLGRGYGCRGWAGAQAVFHECFALVAFQGFGFGVGVAGAHLALLACFSGR